MFTSLDTSPTAMAQAAGMSRRDWLLKVPAAAAGFMSAWIALRFLSASTAGPRTLIVSDPRLLPDRTPIPFGRAGVAVLRDGGRIGAVSMTCTHLGCALRVRDRGFECPCHGSRFDSLGQCLVGPATRDLLWYRLDLMPDGRALVRLGEAVPAGTFTAIG